MHITHTYSELSNLIFHSDIHLSPQSPTITQAYLTHLHAETKDADALYILGDLFDYWIGPETAKLYPEVVACFQSISAATPIYFMPGNRDFLLTDSELAQWGMQIIPDPCLIRYGDRTCLLMHGDLLCTQDTSYQRMRRWIRHALVQKTFLCLPYSFRQTLAQSMRKQSQYYTANKSRQSMLADPRTIQAWLEQTQCDILIYGHIHQQRHQVFTDLKSTPVTALTLDSWENCANFARLYDKICAISQIGCA